MSYSSKHATLALAAACLGAAAIQPPSRVSAQAAASPAPASVEFYKQNVVPIFAANCYRCHGGLNHRGSLVMDTHAGMMKGGKDGSILVPGHPEQSTLIQLMRHEGPADDPMPMPPPPKPKVSDADIAIVTQWVKAGAIMPPDPAK